MTFHNKNSEIKEYYGGNSSFIIHFRNSASQMDKYEYLKEHLETYDDKDSFEEISKIKQEILPVVDDVFVFFNNRTKWKKLEELVEYLENMNISFVLNNNESLDLKVSFF